jgi:hypothetical protein
VIVGNELLRKIVLEGRAVRHCSNGQIEGFVVRGMWHLWGSGRDAYRILIGSPERKIPRGKPRVRWESNIKMDFKEYSGVMWTKVALLRLVNGGFYRTR